MTPCGRDEPIMQVYRAVILARNLSHALPEGSLRWVHANDDVLVFVGESTEQSALVHGAPAARESIAVSVRHVAGVAGANPAYGWDRLQCGHGVSLMADTPEDGIWT